MNASPYLHLFNKKQTIKKCLWCIKLNIVLTILFSRFFLNLRKIPIIAYIPPKNSAGDLCIVSNYSHVHHYKTSNATMQTKKEYTPPQVGVFYAKHLHLLQDFSIDDAEFYGDGQDFNSDEP